LSNAAKNDFLTANEDGTFTFKIEDLLANDAGGAKAACFFFGHGTDQATRLKPPTWNCTELHRMPMAPTR
jgi:hypothetical protein